MKQNYISEAVIRRLPKYYRYLEELSQKNIERVSSREMSEKLGFNASQIRQDFNCFGGFGQQGYGYHVNVLRHEIGKILGLTQTYKAVIIGLGNLGSALANYSFSDKGLTIAAAFDVDETLLKSNHAIPLYHSDRLKEYILENGDIDIAIIATPKSVAQNVTDLIVDAGVKAIWNFAPVDVVVTDDISVENVHLSDSLAILAYRIAQTRN